MPRKKRQPEPAPAAFDVERYLASTSRTHKVVQYRRGAVVFSQGDRARDVKYLQTGTIKLSVLSHSGKEAVVAMLGPGDFFGEGVLTGQPIRIATASAIVASSVLVDRQDRDDRLIHGEATFADRFISHMLTRNIRIEADLVDHLFNSSEKRLARTLLLLARYGKGNTQPDAAQDFTGDAGRDDRRDPLPRELLHEQVQEARIHRIQRRHHGQQIAAHSRPARLIDRRLLRDDHARCGRRRSRRYPAVPSPSASNSTNTCGSVGTDVRIVKA